MVPLSKQQVIDCGTKAGGCKGGGLVTTLDYIKNNSGVCPEVKYPNTSGRTRQSGHCKVGSCSRVDILIESIGISAPSEFWLVAALT